MADGCILTEYNSREGAAMCSVPALWETFVNAVCDVMVKGTVPSRHEKIWSLPKFALGLAWYLFMLEQLSKK